MKHPYSNFPYSNQKQDHFNEAIDMIKKPIDSGYEKNNQKIVKSFGSDHKVFNTQRTTKNDLNKDRASQLNFSERISKRNYQNSENLLTNAKKPNKQNSKQSKLSDEKSNYFIAIGIQKQNEQLKKYNQQLKGQNEQLKNQVLQLKVQLNDIYQQNLNLKKLAQQNPCQQSAIQSTQQFIQQCQSQISHLKSLIQSLSVEKQSVQKKFLLYQTPTQRQQIKDRIIMKLEDQLITTKLILKEERIQRQNDKNHKIPDQKGFLSRANLRLIDKMDYQNKVY